jgi:hypothetical protein
MNDDELIDAGSPRLADLLHRAADGLALDSARELPIELTPPRHTRRPWLLAAAVMLIVAGIGAAWLLTSGDDGQRIDTGPAEPPTVTVSPAVVRDTGIWRLPDPTADVVVIGAQENGGQPAAQLAVDDTDAPTRWVLVGDYGVQGEASGSRTVDAADGMVIVLSTHEGASRSSRFGMRDGESSEYVSGLYAGVDDDDVVQMLTGAFPDRETLFDPELRAAALAGLVAPDGLTPTWDPSVIMRASDMGSADSVQLSLRTDAETGDDIEVAVSITQMGLTPAVTALLIRLQSEQMQLVLPGSDAPVSQELVARPDLGEDVHELRYRADGAAELPGSQLVVMTEDGVTITATRAIESTQVAAAEPLSDADQLRIINSLRALDRPEFVAQLEARGVEFFAAGSVRQAEQGEPPTTVQAPPDD